MCNSNIIINICFRFTALANKLRLFESGYAWILTETIFSTPINVLRDVPFGILAIEGDETSRYDVILHDMVSAVENVVRDLGQSHSFIGSSFVHGTPAMGVDASYLVRYGRVRVFSTLLVL